MDKTALTLCGLLRSSLFGLSATLAQDVDWNAVLQEARAQTIVALVEQAVPSDARGAFCVSASQSKAHFMRALYEQTQLTALLNGAQIPFVILKGAAAAMYYPAPCCRTMGDVDILTAEKDFDAAFACLKENGYVFYGDYGDGRDYSFTKGGVVFELHRQYSDPGHDIEPVLTAAISKRETVSLYGHDFPVLPQAENGLVLLDHIRHHLFGGLGLRQVLDFMMFVNANRDERVWESEYLPLFEKAGLATLAGALTKMCKQTFGLPAAASWCESADDKTCGELLETVLESGNFGRKNPYEYRPMESLTISIKKEGLFRTLQNAGVENSAVIQKHRALRPFAWLYQLFRYAFRGFAALCGRKERLGGVSSGAKKADFYKRLGID